ncbi:MAG TPA: hypothetical protein VHD15_12710 [Hyphomicrobiales bacterium]|nr:hypothetical protein [Hyphomicrobiales bacterium]
MAAPKFKVETTFINSWVETGVYELVVNSTVAEAMRRQKVDLVDVNCVLRTGSVVRSDMDESRGLWDVRGKTVDGIVLELKIAVISTEYEVELLRIVTVRRSGE